MRRESPGRIGGPSWRRSPGIQPRSSAPSLWPTGTIVAPAFPPATGMPLPENGTRYGADVVFGPDPQERVTNPLYGGCYDYNP